MGYYSEVKKNKIMAFVSKWMKLWSIMLSEISKSQKNKGQMIPPHNSWGGKKEWRKDG